MHCFVSVYICLLIIPLSYKCVKSYIYPANTKKYQAESISSKYLQRYLSFA